MKNLKGQIKIDENIMDYARSEIYWETVKNYADLKEAMVMFLKGVLYVTPSHKGPCQMETELIKKRLIRLNRLGCITFNSQPFIEKSGCRQRPYIDCFIKRKHINNIIEKMMKWNNTVIINVFDIEEDGVSHSLQTYTHYDISGKKHIDTHQKKNKDGIFEDFFGTSFWFDKDCPNHCEHYNKYLARYLAEKCVHVEICDMSFSNDIFDQLIRAIKESIAHK